MSHVLVIARREIEEKRLVFVAAIGFAIISLLVPLVPGVHGPAREVIALMSGVLALGYALGIAALLGGNVVGRDVSAGRMSFFFARPVSGVAIWFGKLLAAAVMIVASYLIVAFPALVAGTSSKNSIWRGNGDVIGYIAAGAVALFFLAHGIGTVVRSRSALIAIDFCAAAAATFTGWMIVRPLLDGAALHALRALAWGGAIVLFVAFIAAGAWQVVDGRTDRRRNHVAFSKVFWGIVAAFLVCAGAFAAWIALTPPSALDGIMVTADGGNYAVLHGTTTGRFDYQPAYLLNTADGTTERLGGAWRAENAILSRDGSTFVSLHRRSYTSTTAEVEVRGTKPGSPLVDTSIVVSGWDPIAVSDDGSRLAVVHDRVLEVYEVASRRSLGSVRLDAPVNWLFFAAPDRVKIYAEDNRNGSPKAVARTITAYDYDVASRTLHRGGAITVMARFLRLQANADGSRVIVNPLEGPPLLCDGTSLRTLAQLPRQHTAVFLRDGRIAAKFSDDNTSSLLVLSADGVLQKTIPLGRSARTFHLGEIAPGKVLVSLWERDTEIRHRTAVVDVNSGTVNVTPNLYAATRMFIGITGDPRTASEPPEQLMLDGKQLVAWNALTGTKRVLVTRN
jgi:hypothetical protein